MGSDMCIVEQNICSGLLIDSVLVSCGCVMAVHLLGQFCLRNSMIINRWCGRLAICRSFRRNKRRGIVCR